MEKNTHLGTFWGIDALYFVESDDTKPTKIFHTILNEECKGSIKGGPLSPVGMSTIALIVETFRQNKIPLTSINLSLPTNEIIFRSFIVPWMPASELKDVIEFEATKYIPFALKELAYAYQAQTFSEGSSKRIRVIFTAVKKDSLANYVGILEQAGFEVEVIEPSTISLIRVLSQRKLIPDNQTVVLIEKGKEWGKVIVVNSNAPQFVRDFSIKSSAPDNTDDKSMLNQFLSEIRISLNYFTRQDSHLDIKEIILLSSTDEKDLAASIATETGISTTSMTTQSILQDSTITQLGILNAFGNSLANNADPTLSYNFSAKKQKAVKIKTQITKKDFSAGSVIKVASVCIPLIAISFFLSNGIVEGPRNKVESLKKQLGIYQESTVEKMKEKTEKIEQKIKNYKEIRITSEVGEYLALIPSLLPDGTWIKTMDITYPSWGTNATKKTIEISGYAYLEKTKEQFRLVNKTLSVFKNNKKLSGDFSDIDLVTVKVERLNDYATTFFKIKCQ